MGATNLFLAPGPISPRYAPDHFAMLTPHKQLVETCT